MSEIIITKDNFKSEVLESEIPVLVDFFATWCAPCSMLSPIVSEFAEENEGKIKVAKLNVDEVRDIAMQYKIASIPTLIAFKNGKDTKNIIGLCEKKEIEKLFE